MITTVTQKNMVTIPAAVARELGIVPGYKLAWRVHNGELVAHVIPDRGTLAARLKGSGARHSPNIDAVKALVSERERDDRDEELS